MDVIALSAQDTLSNTTVHEVVIGPVRWKDFVHWKLITAIDVDNLCDSIGLYYRIGTDDRLLHRKAPANSVNSVYVPNEIVLMGDVQLVAKFYGGTSGDTLQFNVYGVEMES